MASLPNGNWVEWQLLRMASVRMATVSEWQLSEWQLSSNGKCPNGNCLRMATVAWQVSRMASVRRASGGQPIHHLPFKIFLTCPTFVSVRIEKVLPFPVCSFPHMLHKTLFWKASHTSFHIHSRKTQIDRKIRHFNFTEKLLYILEFPKTFKNAMLSSAWDWEVASDNI